METKNPNTTSPATTDSLSTTVTPAAPTTPTPIAPAPAIPAPSTPSPTPELGPTVPRFRDAYQRVLDEIQKVPDSELVHINVDVPTTVTTALGVLPKIRELRPQIAALPGFDVDKFDKLETYALALGHAHALWMGASVPSQSLDALSERGATLRLTMFVDATALAQRRLIDGQKLKELKGANGFRNLAFDLLTLAAVLRDAWPRVAGKTAVSLDELDQAENLADQMLTAVGIREQGAAVVAEAADIRNRAFAIFVSAYDHARRAVSFLRWNEGDLDQIAPSLYAGRARRKQGTDVPAPGTSGSGAPASTPGVPVPSTPGSALSGPVPGAPHAAGHHDEAGPGHAEDPAFATTEEVPIGAPGGSPFLRE